MLIGFNNGDLRQVMGSWFDNKLIDLLYSEKTKALELHTRNEEELQFLIKDKHEKYNKFDFLSIHWPDLHGDEDTIKYLETIRQLSKNLNIKNLVLHPHKMKNRDMLTQFKDLPISIENMDDMKPSHQTVEEIWAILDKYDFLGLTLDLQHCYVNDKSMKLAKDYHDKYENRIVEYHISGYCPKIIHWPLFDKDQNIIIHNLKHKHIPTIIESGFDSIDKLNLELNYILDNIK